MRRKLVGFGIAALIFAALFPLLRTQVRAEGAGKEVSHSLPTRLRISLLKVEPIAPGTSIPSATLAELAPKSAGAIVPVDSGARATGWFGSVRTTGSIVALLRKAGLTANVVESGEVEGRALFHPRPGRTPESMDLNMGGQLPVTVVRHQGAQTITSTSYKMVGLRFKGALRGDDDTLNENVEFSAVSAFGSTDGGQNPVLFHGSFDGTVDLPDAYTAVFAFTDHVPHEVLGGDKDLPVRYFVLVTRLDLTAGK